MPTHYKINQKGESLAWKKTHRGLLLALTERRSLIVELLTKANVGRRNACNLEEDVEVGLKKLAIILLRFVDTCHAISDRPTAYLQHAIQNLGTKPRRLLTEPEKLEPEAVARLAEQYAGRSKKFKLQWHNYELGQGELDFARVKVASGRALKLLKNEVGRNRKGGPTRQELPRLLARALALLLASWGIGIGRQGLEESKEEGNLLNLIEIVKPLISQQYRELTGRVLSEQTMVRYAIAQEKLRKDEQGRKPGKRPTDTASSWVIFPPLARTPLDRWLKAKGIKPSPPEVQKRREISRGFLNARSKQ